MSGETGTDGISLYAGKEVKIMKKLCGTVVPIVTPFTDRDTIDDESLMRLIDYVISGNLQGLFPCGTTGEMMYLTVEERKHIAEVTVRYADGRVPVFIHTGAWNLQDTIELSRHAEKIGADGIGIVTPPFFHISDQGLIDFYVAAAKSVSADFPVYLYAIPQNAVNDLNPDVCEEIARLCQNVVGIKYSYPDFLKMQQFMLVRGGRFSVLSGPDGIFAPFCAAGGDGVVSSNAMVLREHYAAIWDAVQKNDYELAARYQRRTNRLNEVICRINGIAALKVILKSEGILRTDRVRRPYENLSDRQAQALLEELRRLDYKNVSI